jgi:hypothetical protein
VTSQPQPGARREPVALANLPDGLRAMAVVSTVPDGEGGRRERRHRSGRRRLDRAVLVTGDYQAPGADAAVIDPADRAWLLDAGQRRWSSFEQRFGARAWAVACHLARGGHAEIDGDIDERQRFEPRFVRPVGDWAAESADQRQRAATERAALLGRASAAADAVEPVSESLATALRRPGISRESLAVLCPAAEDLAAGRRHDSPRAFSQVHFGDTKHRDDVDAALARAGVSARLRELLGVRRAARIGVAGPVTAIAVDGREVALGALAGVTQLSVADGRPRLRCAPGCTAVVVENLQAAESAAARFPGVAVLWVAGRPGEDELAALAGGLADAGRVLVIPDADAGGVTIAERVCSVRAGAEVIDVGEQPHMPGRRLSEQALRQLAAVRNGPAGSLAAACLRRGYRVEQEATTGAAITRAVNRGNGSAS